PGGDRAWGLEAADPRAKVSAMRLLVEKTVLTYLLTYNRSGALVKRFFAFFSSIAPEARPLTGNGIRPLAPGGKARAFADIVGDRLGQSPAPVSEPGPDPHPLRH